MPLQQILQQALGTSTITSTGRGGGGCINHGEAYMVDSGTVFVKMNGKKNVSKNCKYILLPL
jgi:fructosamine-3-kinase